MWDQRVLLRFGAVVWGAGAFGDGDSVVPSWSCFGGCLGLCGVSPGRGSFTHCPWMGRAWQVERVGSGSSGDTAWLHLAVTPGLPLLPGQPLCFSSLAFLGKGPPRPEDLPSTPAHPEAPPARLEHRRRPGCPAGPSSIAPRPRCRASSTRPTLPTRPRCRILPVSLVETPQGLGSVARAPSGCFSCRAWLQAGAGPVAACRG